MNLLTQATLLLLQISTYAAAQQPRQVELLDSAWHAYERGDFTQAKKYNRACIDKSRLANDLKTQAQCMINNGTIALDEGDFNGAYAWYDSSYRLYNFIGDTIQTVNALRNMAITTRRLSRYEQGIRHGNTALMLLRKPGHDALKARVYNTLATLFEATNNQQQARNMLRKALPLIAEESRPYVYTNLGNTHFKTDNIDSAIRYYRAGLNLSSDSVLRALILNNLGESYILADSLTQASNALTQSLAIRKAIDTLALTSTYNNLAQLALRQKKNQEAGRYLTTVHQHLAKAPDERELLKFLLLQKTYYENAGQYQKSFLLDKRYDSLNRKLFEEERIKASELQTAYELSERDNQLALQQQTLTLRSAELEHETFLKRLTTGIVCILLLVAALLFYLYRINAKLRHKNEMLIHEQNHRVKNNLQMIASLLSIQSSAHTDESVKTILSQNETRIQSIALLHRMLYNADVSADLPLQTYLKDLAEELRHALGASDTVFDIKTEIERLSIENTVSLGLIFNELITNSVKYATGNPLRISIALSKTGKGAELQYSDNGKNFDPANFTASGRFGARLIFLQSKQLNGKYTVINRDGFCFVLTFPLS